MRYFHGSNTKLPIGTVLVPNFNYEDVWRDADFYEILEQTRPSHMLAHRDAVFMCDNEDDIDCAGGGTEWLFEVEPLRKVQRHDVNWSSEISCLYSEEEIGEDRLLECCANYWNGVPHPNENVWEYLTPKARIISVQLY